MVDAVEEVCRVAGVELAGDKVGVSLEQSGSLADGTIGWSGPGRDERPRTKVEGHAQTPKLLRWNLALGRYPPHARARPEQDA